MKDLVFKTVMLKGEGGTSIDRIEKTSSSGVVDTYTIYFDDDKEPYTFEVTNGYSIISIEKTATLGNIDTYTVTLDNGDTYNFDVTNSNVANSMTAADETTVAPSMSAAKDFINNVTDADGVLFCGDFVNVPNSSIYSIASTPRGAHYGLGWRIPDWLIWEDGKGLKIDNTKSSFFLFLTPKYHNRNISLSDLGIDKLIISVEWSKEGDSEIHTSTKVITDTVGNYGWTVMELEPNIKFRMNYLYYDPSSENYGGCSEFSVKTDGNTIQGTYYIRKIKLEKGDIATPFSLNKSQFFALQIFNDFIRTWAFPIASMTEITGTLTTGSDGSCVIAGALPEGYNLNNTLVDSIAIKLDDQVYLGTWNGLGYADNDNMDFSVKLRLIDNIPHYVLAFKCEWAPTATLPYRVSIRKAFNPFS